MHTAYKHIEHTISCGCATKKEDAVFICKSCGAAYDSELDEFIVFVCYDCKGTKYRGVKPDDIFKEELPSVTLTGKDYAELMEKVRKFEIIKSNLEQLIQKFKSLGLDIKNYE